MDIAGAALDGHIGAIGLMFPVFNACVGVMLLFVATTWLGEA